MPKIYENIAVSLARADEILAELFREYDRSLQDKTVSTKAKHLTHEICTMLRRALDRTVRRYWDIHLAPNLSTDDREAAKIYFPIAPHKAGFDSVLGRWRWKSPRNHHQPVYDFLLAQQAFAAAQNGWLSVLGDLSNQEHIELVPQKRHEARQITVTGAGGGSVSWGPGVTFGGGVSVMGAPIDPRTQRIVPTPGVKEKTEIWVSFLIDGHGVNAASFCQEACRETRRILQEMTDNFGLS